MSIHTAQKRIEKARKATYNITASQLDAMENRIKQECLNEAFQLLMAIPVKVLSEKFNDFTRVYSNGKSREERFAEALLEEFQEFQNGKIRVEDCLKLLKTKCGMDLMKKGGGKDA